MKLEEINNKTNEAFSFLVAALESGESEVLMQYLNAMAQFHTYSFGNIMLIARQKPTATRVAGIRTWNSLGRGSDGRFGLRRFRAKHKAKAFGTRRAFPHALPPSFETPFPPFASVTCFFLAAAQVKEKTSRHRQKGKNNEIRGNQQQNQ